MNVCLVGNNLTSLALAKSLINKKIKVTMYYKKKSHYIDNNIRTIGISLNNIKFIQNKIIKINKFFLWDINKIEIYDESKSYDKVLNFSEFKKKLFYIIKNNQFYKLLYNDLEKNINFKKKKIKNSESYKKIINNPNYNLIINCDSKNEISKKYFSKKIYKNYNSIAYVAIINHKKIKNKKAVQIFTKSGPVAFLPISETNTSVVCSIKNSRKKKKFSQKEFEEFILSNNIEYEIKNITKFDTFKLEFKSPKNYFFKNILAFGDGLHQIHPLAGQGFNMTIRDIKVLLDLINDRQNLGLPIDETINEDFENQTKHFNFLFSSGIDFIFEFFNFKNYYFKYYSNRLLKNINKNRLLSNLFIKFADRGLNN